MITKAPTHKYLGPFAAMFLAATQTSGVSAQESAKIPASPLQSRKAVMAKIHTANQQNKDTENEIKKNFYQILERKFDSANSKLTDTYWDLVHKIDAIKEKSKNYLPDFSEEFNKKECITVDKFAIELNKLTEEFSKQPNLDTTLKCIDAYRQLCHKDLNRRFLELCLQEPFNPYTYNFIKAHEAFQKKISDQLIRELSSLEDYKKIEVKDLEKFRKISDHLSNLHNLSYEHSVTKLFEHLSGSERITKFPKQYRDLNSFPELNKFFQEELLPMLPQPKAVLDGNEANINQFIKHSVLSLNLNNILNCSDSFSFEKDFFKLINYQLTDCFVNAIQNPNKGTKEASLKNLQKFLTPLSETLGKRDEAEYINLLNNLVNQSLNPQTNLKEIYYKVINKIINSKLILNPNWLKPAQKDLAELIKGTDDKIIQTQLHTLLASSLINDIYDHEYNINFQTYLDESTANPYQRSQVFTGDLSAKKILLQELFKVLNPTNLFADKKDTCSEISDILNINKIREERSSGNNRLTIPDLIKLNQRYLNVLNLVESIFLKARLKLNSPDFEYRIKHHQRNGSEYTDKLNQAYTDFQRQFSARFSLEGRSNTDHTHYIDAFIQGKAFGHFLEADSSPLSIPSTPSGNECSISAPITRNKIMPIYWQPKSKFCTELDHSTFPSTAEIESHLELNFISEKPSDIKIVFGTNADQAFVLGALTTTPSSNNPLERLKNRFNMIVKTRYPHSTHLVSEAVRDFFIKEAMLIQAKNYPKF